MFFKKSTKKELHQAEEKGWRERDRLAADKERELRENFAKEIAAREIDNLENSRLTSETLKKLNDAHMQDVLVLRGQVAKLSKDLQIKQRNLEEKIEQCNNLLLALERAQINFRYQIRDNQTLLKELSLFIGKIGKQGDAVEEIDNEIKEFKQTLYLLKNDVMNMG
jgi:vacuolar-type H+-ATPase subunit I/STV1